MPAGLAFSEERKCLTPEENPIYCQFNPTAPWGLDNSLQKHLNHWLLTGVELPLCWHLTPP